MDLTIDQAELFPVVEEKLGRWARWRIFREAMEREGPMIPRAMLPLLLDVSKQRVEQLVREGRIATVQVHNCQLVPYASLEAYLADERRSGRPVRENTLREAIRRGTGR